MSTSRLIVGCGYLGERVARRWLEAGDSVGVVTRSSKRAAELQATSLRPIVADVTDPGSLVDLPETKTVLFAVGYDRGAGKSIDTVYAKGLANVLAHLSPSVERVVYLSTTGVYGDAGGDWIDESTPPSPQRDGGHASLAAEQVLGASLFADQGVVLRLAGLYGPDRIPFLQQLRAGEPIGAPEAGWLNLIHVDDAASAVVAAAEARSVPPVVCVSDGNPPQRGEYYRHVAELLGAPPARFCQPEAGSPRAARASANKRVGNRLLLEQLATQPAYPTYREGLAASLAQEKSSG